MCFNDTANQILSGGIDNEVKVNGSVKSLGLFWGCVYLLILRRVLC